MKLPSSVGQKKTKAIESMLLELGIEVNPMPTEEIGDHFNDLRSEMVLHYDLKSALQNSEFEVQTLMHRKQALDGGGGGGGGSVLSEGIAVPKMEEEVGDAEPEVVGRSEDVSMEEGVEEVKTEVEEMEEEEVEEENKDGEGAVVGTNSLSQKPTKKGVVDSSEVSTTQKKRKAALEQKNVLNKLKNR